MIDQRGRGRPRRIVDGEELDEPVFEIPDDARDEASVYGGAITPEPDDTAQPDKPIEEPALCGCVARGEQLAPCPALLQLRLTYDYECMRASDHPYFEEAKSRARSAYEAHLVAVGRAIKRTATRAGR